VAVNPLPTVGFGSATDSEKFAMHEKLCAWSLNVSSGGYGRGHTGHGVLVLRWKIDGTWDHGHHRVYECLLHVPSCYD
jgi:hypothetical protein